MKKPVVNSLKKVVPNSFIPTLRKYIGTIRSAGKTKIFGIGRNKTGTTSLKLAMKELGFIVGHQRTAENLIFDWAKRDFKQIVSYCKTAEFFQDVPFSKPFTFVVLDHEFLGSKFILTIRDSPEQWYNSVVKFQSKKWGLNGRIPTKEDLQEATYIYKGRPWDTKKLSTVTPENDPYNKELLIKSYINYNESVKDYFHHRKDDLLILNVSEKGAYLKLCDFLNVDPVREEFPWKNKTGGVGTK